MAIVIDNDLAASPEEVGLPSGPIQLEQSLHSTLEDGETVRITYSLDPSSNIFFRTQAGTAKQIQTSAKIPNDSIQRSDTVELVRSDDDTSMDEVVIKQLIVGKNKARDAVAIAIQS
jgi:hypothetical protein